VEPGSPTGQPVARIRNDDDLAADLDRDHSQQDDPARTDSAADTRADGPLTGCLLERRLPGRLTGHRESSASARPNLPAPASAGAHAPAPRAGADRSRPAPTAGAGADRSRPAPTAGASTSGRMSIRQPVSLAARRAFCPSLPMASDSW
jgi:hypothetical protein